MTIFAIFRASNPGVLGPAIERAYPQDYLKLQDDEWLVSASGTAKQISDRIGVTPGNNLGSAIVFSMADYYGRATTEIWDWIKAKAEKSGG